jgi:two-component system cell cycle sensor histidine kinase/response regulator CckA
MQKNEQNQNASIQIREKAQNLLHLGKGPSDRYKLIFVQECNNLVQEVAKILSRTGHEYIHVYAKLDKNLLPVRASAKKLQHSILEIALNSVEAVSKGGKILFQTASVRIADSISSPQYKTNHRYFIQFSIIDNGHGMSNSVKKKMFNPSFTTKDPALHCGRSLTTVKKTISEFGGSIKVKTCEGIGTAIHIILPAAKITLPNRDISFEEKWRQRKGRLLLVDDEPAFQNTAASMLSRYGYKVIRAGTATEAKIMFKIYCKKIDVVLLDLTLMDTDIRDLLNFLIGTNPKVKMIVTFGLGEEEIINDLSAYHFAGSIRKPYFFLPLIRTVKKALEG